MKLRDFLDLYDGRGKICVNDNNLRIENLYQFRQPLTFNFKGIDFTVSK